MKLQRVISAILFMTFSMARGVGQVAPVGVIEVTVNTADGVPIDDADVTLIFTPYPTFGILGGTDGKEFAPLRTEGTKTASKSDRGSRAVFRNLGPGFYGVVADRKGFIKTHAGASSVQFGNYPQPPSLSGKLAAAEENSPALPDTRQVRLILAPAGTISGRVQDAAGRAVPNASVAAMQWAYQDGEKTLTSAGDSTTNDLGEYRLPQLAAGEYYIRVQHVYPIASGFFTYATPIYFPGTIGPKSASPVIVREGQDATGVNVTIPDRSGVTISGTIIDLLPEVTATRDAARGGLPIRFLFAPELKPTGEFGEPRSSLLSGGMALVNLARESPFEIRFVPPGEYDFYPIVVDRSSSQQTNYTGRTRISVGSDDVKNVVAKVGKGTDIHGRVRFSDGRNTPVDFVENIELIPLESVPSYGSFMSRSAFVKDGRTDFSITNLIEARYRLAPITELPHDDYLADIRANGRSVFNEGSIDVAGDPIDLELVIGNGGARIEGNVQLPTISSMPVAIAVTVVLVPDEPRRGNAGLYRSTNFTLTPPVAGVAVRPDLGSFSFSSIAPGNYRIFAWEDLPRGGAEMNPDFLAKYDGRGVPVVVSQGMAIRALRVPIIRTP